MHVPPTHHGPAKIGPQAQHEPRRYRDFTVRCGVMRRVLLYLALERVTCEALEVKRRDATRIGYRAKIDERVERRRSKILIIVPCARGAHATARPRTLHADGAGRDALPARLPPKMTVTSQHFGHTRKHCEFVLDLASTSPVVCLPSSYPIRDPICAPPADGFTSREICLLRSYSIGFMWSRRTPPEEGRSAD